MDKIRNMTGITIKDEDLIPSSFIGRFLKGDVIGAKVSFAYLVKFDRDDRPRPIVKSSKSRWWYTVVDKKVFTFTEKVQKTLDDQDYFLRQTSQMSVA